MPDLASKLLLALVTFVLTGIVGNWLVQRWQARTWIAQQRFLGFEKEYVALKDLVEEIGQLLGARIYYMQRLAFALRSGVPETVSLIAAEHDEAVRKWNERLASFLCPTSDAYRFTARKPPRGDFSAAVCQNFYCPQ